MWTVDASTLTIHIGMSRADLNATAASLLGFLHDGPKTGWDLVEAIECSVGYFWNVTRSQVYRELKTLAEQGYVTEKRAGARDKVPYAITTAGRHAFAVWIAREPGPDTLRLPLVLTVFFGRHVPPELLRRYVQKARIEHRERLDAYRKLEGEGTPGDEFQRSALEVGIAYEEAVLGWLEKLSWLEKGAKKAGRRKGS
jgi:DNA-binding PadR family transcriptional regulator